MLPYKNNNASRPAVSTHTRAKSSFPLLEVGDREAIAPYCLSPRCGPPRFYITRQPLHLRGTPTATVRNLLVAVGRVLIAARQCSGSREGLGRD